MGFISDLINTGFSWIESYSSSDLEYAINNDLNLAEGLLKEKPNEISAAKMFRPIFEYELKKISAKDVLDNIKSKRPDLYKIIVKDKKGITWFVKNVKALKDLVLK